MKIKVGEIVNKEVAKSGKTQLSIASDVGLSTVQLRKILRQPMMEMKYVLGIGKSIRFDFSKYFPELNSERLSKIVDEALEPLATMGNEELRDRIIEIQNKYVNLLEEHIQLLKKINDQL